MSRREVLIPQAGKAPRTDCNLMRTAAFSCFDVTAPLLFRYRRCASGHRWL